MRLLLIILMLSVLTSSLYGQPRFLAGANNVRSEKLISKIVVDNHFIDSFTFTTKWDYPPFTIKEKSGRFSTGENRKLTPKDTAHLFFTANCSTNVQGGYDIRYCYAEERNGEIVLTFVDGAPAYNSEFYVHIKGSEFWTEAQTIYPILYENQKKSCATTKQTLILNKSNYAAGDTIKGYVNMEFVETMTIPRRGTQKRNLFLKGYFKTPIQKPSSR